MRFALYGTKSDNDEIMRSLAVLPEWYYRKIQGTSYSDYDEFIAGLGESMPDCIIIAMDGADGMEGVIAARDVCGDVPVLWFSNDGGFGVQSYRLGCTYFHKKPVPPQKLLAAVTKCM